MKQRRRDRYGRLEPWVSRKKPHLFPISHRRWFATGLNQRNLPRGAYGDTPEAAYNALMTFIAQEHFGLR